MPGSSVQRKIECKNQLLFFAFHLANFFELAAAAACVCEARSGQKTFFSRTLFLPLKKHTPIKTVRGQ